MAARFQVFSEDGHVSEHRTRTAAEAAARRGSKRLRVELRVYEGGFAGLRDPIASFYLGEPFPHASPREAAERALARVPSVAPLSRREVHRQHSEFRRACGVEPLTFAEFSKLRRYP